MSDRIDVGIIGAGNIARTHVNAYQSFPEEVALVAFADIYEEKARQMAERAGATAYYADYKRCSRAKTWTLSASARRPSSTRATP